MKCVMVMFDSLNRHMLPCYNPDTWVKAPNFRRLAERTVTFDKSYVCSMPCMPARRDLHTGRPNFFHNRWCPLEPWDDSLPVMLKQQKGVASHMVTDHYHYFEDGGAHYCTRYGTWEFFRGQEGDPWKGQVARPPVPDNINGKGKHQDWVNRPFMDRADRLPINQSFNAAREYIDRNHDEDNWFLQLETFDPHEPWHTMREHRDRYAEHFDRYDGPLFDWPGYQPVNETPEQIKEAQHRYASLLSLCDQRMGDILDTFDRYNLWEDTMLVVWTDHGFLLGEHDCWAKNWMPLYEEVAHTPFFMWDPRSGKKGERRESLVQPAIDLAPTLLDFFGAEPTPDMTGKNLAPVVANDEKVRDYAVFGYFGSRINVTDGKHVLMKGVEDRSVGQDAYTLRPGYAGIRGVNDAMLNTTQSEALAFTKGLKPLRVPVTPPTDEPTPGDADPLKHATWGDLLYDVESDPRQQSPLDDADVAERLKSAAAELMQEVHAPENLYQRYGIHSVV